MPFAKRAGISERLARIVAEVAKVEPERVEEETDLVRDLHLDSVHLLDIIMRVEEEFGIVAGPEFEEPKMVYQLQQLLEHASLRQGLFGRR